MAPAALLHTALQNPFRIVHGFYENITFFDGVRNGLLQIDILPGRQSVRSYANVPVIGRGDEDGVNLFFSSTSR